MRQPYDWEAPAMISTCYQQGPSPIIFLLPACTPVRNGLVRTGKRAKGLGKPKSLKHPLQPIPTFDRKELRERVNRLLRETQRERDECLNKS
jgi:hypothetical protein